MPVFHLDIDAFMTTVERIKDPSLKTRPLVIAPDKPRAVVLSASADAKAIGITKGMPLTHIRKLYPGVHILPPNTHLYDRANRFVLGVANRFTPILEPLSYGHVALDMQGMRRLFGNLENAAYQLCKELQAQGHIPATVGIAGNKLVSLIAAKEVQRHGESLARVPVGEEPGFLAPLPCKALPEWDQVPVRKLLFELNLRRIHQVQAIPPNLLCYAAGATGHQLHRHAMGIDPRPVTPPQRTQQLTADHVFQPDTNDDANILAAIHALLERLCQQLRSKGLAANGIRIDIKYVDDVWSNRRYNFTHTQQEKPIFGLVENHLSHMCHRRQRVRYLRLCLDGLYTYYWQPSLFDEPADQRISPHLDQLRARFGDSAIRYGKSLHADVGAA